MRYKHLDVMSRKIMNYMPDNTLNSEYFASDEEDPLFDFQQKQSFNFSIDVIVNDSRREDEIDRSIDVFC